MIKAMVKHLHTLAPVILSASSVLGIGHIAA